MKIINNNELTFFLEKLKILNPHLSSLKDAGDYETSGIRPYKLQKVLIANRGEIAKRFFLTLHEEGINSVAVVTDVDKGQSWYEFADEIVYIGESENYSNPDMIIAATLIINANAIYSGYGFLSENHDFVKQIDSINKLYDTGIIFMGPGYETMRIMGDKINARRLAFENNIPLFESSGIITSGDIELIKREAGRIGFPVMIKLSAGGGGKGMYLVESENELEHAVNSSMRIGSENYNNSSFYIEKYISNPIHIEVQIFNGKTIGIRKCAVQRRNQKIIEESGETFFDDNMNQTLLSLSEKIAYLSNYDNNCGAGTVEFLIDQDTNQIGFLEMNTRLQVEYAVTDQSLGIDLAKCHILLYDGRENEFDYLDKLKSQVHTRNHSIECRVYAEDPENNYQPSPGIITEINLPTFNGIRCDFGFRDGDKILPMYDPMIGKLIVNGQTRHEALIRMERALQELYIKGVKTNIPQLLNIIRHPEFKKGNYNNRIISKIDESKSVEDENTSNKSGYNQIIFGAFVEYIELSRRAISEFHIISNIKGITNTPAADIPTKITIEYENNFYTVEFIQISLDSHHIILNELYYGKLTLNFINEKSDDLILMYLNNSYRIRVERRNEFLILKLKEDTTNKINYYNIKVIHDKNNEDDNVEIIRSPFQGTFVSFCNDIKTGDEVKTGDPLFVLSAMKMETTICSTAEGNVIYIFSDKFNLKPETDLNTGNTLYGKNIQEGEILLKIEKSSGKKLDIQIKTVPPQDVADYQPFNFFLNNNFESLIIEEPQVFINLLFSIFYSIICGFTTQEYIIEKMDRISRGIKFYKWKSLFDKSLTESIEKVIMHYIYVKRIFSSTVSSDGMSFSEELDVFIMQLRNENINLSPDFNSLLLKILDYYGIPESDFTLKSNRNQLHQILFHVRRSYRFTLDHPDFIKYIVYIVPFLNIPKNRIVKMIGPLLESEKTEKDDTFAKYIKNEIYDKINDNGTPLFSEDEDDVSDIKYFFNYLGMDSGEYIQKICKPSLNEPEQDLIPDNINDYQKNELKLRIDLLNKKYKVKRLKSPINDVIIFWLQDQKSDESSYLAFSILDFNYLNPEKRYRIIEKSIGNTLAIISLYQNAKPNGINWIHVIINGITLILYNNDFNISKLSYNETKQKFMASIISLKGKSQIRGIMESDFQFTNQDPVKHRQIFFNSDINSNVFEFIYKQDNRNLYHNTETFSADNQKIYNLNKWPIEIWANECFDSGSFEEIRIESIDYISDNTGGDAPVNNIVGAKIYSGKINGENACFFMKDSRVNGGSTGNLEGLKYVAAAYISFLKQWPLYIWNDGAGANIKQGIVSLNRGAEGFMMNALLVKGDYNHFKNHTFHHPDPVLKTLFTSLDAQFNLLNNYDETRRTKIPLVAVGIGSSAGLDVYGSSQAVFQIMLDSNESYRVLTGSNVIRSVIGENISNYDIGGAEILGKRTGIIDMVANNKIKLIQSIRRINKFFCIRNQSSLIKRRDDILPSAPVKLSDMIILTESAISENVDDGEFLEMKKEYYGAESLLGGFARIGGRRVLILGARTHFGHRSSVSVIKILELLKLARRTALSEILIFGRNWIQPEILEDNSFRPQLDFMNALHKNPVLRIHIIMHIDGLKIYYINNSADVIIFINSRKQSASDNNFIKKNSTFVVDSLAEAFDLAAKINNMLFPIGSVYPVDCNGIYPSIPSDTSIPYDMIRSVIVPVFDSGSFVEFYSGMNINGSFLITGLARLNGVTTGIIADQPLQKGGAADAHSTEKFRIFTKLLNRLNIPLIMLSSSSGFLPGSQQERLRIQAIGAESLNANILGQIPVVSVVLTQNYGGRLIHAFNKFLRPGIVYLALESAVLSVIGVNVAFDLFNKKVYLQKIEDGKIEEAEKFKKDFYTDYLNKAKASNNGIETNLVDWIIPDQKELRDNLISGMNLAVKRCREAFSK